MSYKEILPVTPGEVLMFEFMRPMGLTAYQIAKDTSMPQSRIRRIMNGEQRISAETAIRLGIYFGTAPEFWMNLQSHYDIQVAMEEHAPAIKRGVRPMGWMNKGER